jgi:membrane-associated phospholipid phosphatase
MMTIRRGLGTRMTTAVVAFSLAAVPVTVLAYAASHGWGPLHSVDQGTANRLHDWASAQPGVVSFLEAVSKVFAPSVLRIATAVIVVFLLFRRQRRLAAWAATTMIAAGVLGYLLKVVVERARPQLPDPVTSAPGFSFPSGHALNSFAFFAMLVLLLAPLLSRRGAWAAWSLAGAIVLLVGFARVALGVHYVSDVVAGWLVAAGVVAVTTVAFETWRRERGEVVEPVLTEGVDPRSSQSAAKMPG